MRILAAIVCLCSTVSGQELTIQMSPSNPAVGDRITYTVLPPIPPGGMGNLPPEHFEWWYLWDDPDANCNPNWVKFATEGEQLQLEIYVASAMKIRCEAHYNDMTSISVVDRVDPATDFILFFDAPIDGLYEDSTLHPDDPLTANYSERKLWFNITRPGVWPPESYVFNSANLAYAQENLLFPPPNGNGQWLGWAPDPNGPPSSV